MGTYSHLGKQVLHSDGEITTHIADAADPEKAHFLATAANAYREPDMPLFEHKRLNDGRLDPVGGHTTETSVTGLHGEDEGTPDALRQLEERGRQAVREAMGESLLREPTKAPEGTRVDLRQNHGYGYKPRGFA